MSLDRTCSTGARGLKVADSNHPKPHSVYKAIAESSKKTMKASENHAKRQLFQQPLSNNINYITKTHFKKTPYTIKPPRSTKPTRSPRCHGSPKVGRVRPRVREVSKASAREKAAGWSGPEGFRKAASGCFRKAATCGSSFCIFFLGVLRSYVRPKLRW